MTTLQSIQALLAADFGVALEAVQPETALEDLAIDSLAVLEVMFAVEDKFGITVPSGPEALKDGIRTVADLVDYVDRLAAEQRPVGAETMVTS